LVPVRDPAALAAAIHRLGCDDGLRTRMAERARSRAEEHFDERAVVRIVLDTYAELAANKGIAVPGG
jgi:glycosyltransferase involved in cell wall biosynthesis